MNRLRWMFACLLLCLLGPAHAGDPFELEWRELSKDVWVGVRPVSWRQPVMTSTVVVIGRKGVLVFDAAGLDVQGERLVRKVRELTDRPITHIAISHWHGDHSMGIGAVLAAFPEAQVIAHEFTARVFDSPLGDKVEPRDATAEAAYRERVKQTLATGIRSDGSQLMPSMRTFLEGTLEHYDVVLEEIARRAPAQPTLTFDRRLTLDLGGKRAELHHLAPGNTKGDVFLWLPEEKILATGDIVVAPTPYGFFSYPESWIGVLRELQSLTPRYVVPGHGEIMADTKYLDLLAEALQLVVDQVAPLVRQGKSLEQVRAAMDFSAVEPRFTAGDPMLAYLFDVWFKTPIVEAQYNLSTGKDNEPLEGLPTP